MRGEGEIRREVEARLKRRALLLVDGGLWLLTGLAAFFYYSNYGFSTTLGSTIFFFMLAWTALLMLHTLRTLYVEMRERLVRSAIERERQFYLLRDNYEKRKRDEASERDASEATYRLSDDGELIDYPQPKVKADYD